MTSHPIPTANAIANNKAQVLFRSSSRCIGAFMLAIVVGFCVGDPSPKQKSQVYQDSLPCRHGYGAKFHGSPQYTIRAAPAKKTVSEFLTPVKFVMDDCPKLVPSKGRKHCPDKAGGRGEVSCPARSHNDWAILFVDEKKRFEKSHVLPVREVIGYKREWKMGVVTSWFHWANRNVKLKNFNG